MIPDTPSNSLRSELWSSFSPGIELTPTILPLSSKISDVSKINAAVLRPSLDDPLLTAIALPLWIAFAIKAPSLPTVTSWIAHLSSDNPCSLLCSKFWTTFFCACWWDSHCPAPVHTGRISGPCLTIEANLRPAGCSFKSCSVFEYFAHPYHRPARCEPEKAFSCI